MTTPEFAQKIVGCALGACIGDALGMPLEFQPPTPEKRLVSQMIAGRLPAGTFTDDTEMALALADSLANHHLLNPDDLVKQFLSWYRHNPSDIGIQTRLVLSAVANGQPWKMAVDQMMLQRPNSSGNGSIMRCWPAAIVNWNNREQLISDSIQQSIVTHPHPDCVAGCIFVNQMIYDLFHGESINDSFQDALQNSNLTPKLKDYLETASGRQRKDLENSGWVWHTLESCIWALLNTQSLEDALIQVVNLGADADTAGAVTGAIAGAAYGAEAFPIQWVDALRGEWPLGSGKILNASLVKDFAIRLARI